MSNLELSFNLVGEQPLAADHGYALYGAISRQLPQIHSENGIGVHPIAGRQVGQRQLMLTRYSRLTLRVVDGEITPLLSLAGTSLRVGESMLRVGVPQVRPLIPATALRSRLVVIKVSGITAKQLTPKLFLGSAQKQLDTMGISREVLVTLGKRRTMRIKQREIVGYEMLVEGLSAEESLVLQETGLGGKRHMGCGVFVPLGGAF